MIGYQQFYKKKSFKIIYGTIWIFIILIFGYSTFTVVFGVLFMKMFKSVNSVWSALPILTPASCLFYCVVSLLYRSGIFKIDKLRFRLSFKIIWTLDMKLWLTSHQMHPYFWPWCYWFEQNSQLLLHEDSDVSTSMTYKIYLVDWKQNYSPLQLPQHLVRPELSWWKTLTPTTTATEMKMMESLYPKKLCKKKKVLNVVVHMLSMFSYWLYSFF